MNRGQLVTLALRQWWNSRVLNLVMIVVLSMGVVLYLMYGAWQTAVRERLVLNSEPLELAVPFVVRGPDDMERTLDSRLRLFEHLESPLVDRVAETVAPALAAELLTPVGHVSVFGVDFGVPKLRPALQVTAGNWPEAPDQTLLPESLRGYGIEPGDTLQVAYFDSLGRRELRWGDLTVAGFYSPQGDVIRNPIVGLAWLEELIDKSPNAAIVWPRPGVEPERFHRIVRDAFPAGLDLRRPMLAGLVPEGENDLSEPGALKGASPLPYAHRVELTVFLPELPKTAAARQLMDVSVPLSKLVALILLVVFVAVTLGILGMLFDQQRNIGLFVAVGATMDDLRALVGLTFIVNVISSLIFGTATAAVVVSRLSAVLYLPLQVQWGSVVLWTLAYTALVAWIGRLVAVFVGESQTTELLRGRARPDFWAFIRL